MGKKSKKHLVFLLVLVLIIAAAAGVLLYISKSTYSEKELWQLGEDIMTKQSSNVYHVSGAHPDPYGESKLLIGIDDISDAKIEAFKKDWPKLHYKYIEFRDTKDMVSASAT